MSEGITESQTVFLWLKASNSCEKSLSSFRGYNVLFSAKRSIWSTADNNMVWYFEVVTGLTDLQSFELLYRKSSCS